MTLTHSERNELATLTAIDPFARTSEQSARCYALLFKFNTKNLAQLVRTLNANGWKAGRSFYNDGRKLTQARTRGGKLEVSMCGRDWLAADPHSSFDDGNGNDLNG